MHPMYLNVLTIEHTSPIASNYLHSTTFDCVECRLELDILHHKCPHVIAETICTQVALQNEIGVSSS